MDWTGLLVVLTLLVGAVIVFTVTVTDLTWSDLWPLLSKFAAKYEASKTSDGVLNELNRVVKGKVSNVSVHTVRLDLLNSDDTRLAELVIRADEVSSVISQDDVIWV